MKRLFLTAALGVVCASSFAQGTFRNLDFELAQVPSSTPDQTMVAASSAFPFWTVYLGSSEVSSVLYNGITAGTAAVILISTNSPVWANSVIQARYTAILAAGGLFGDASIAQTGTIPAGTKSLLFTSSIQPPSVGGWTVTVGSQVIPVVEVAQVSPILAVYGGDISAFAGQTEQLRFTALQGSPPGSIILDDIQFSPVAVPEPSALALAGLGSAAMLALRRRCVPAFGE